MSYDAIDDAIRTTGRTPTDVWMSYSAIAGNLGRDELRSQLEAAGQLHGRNRAALVECLNDWFVERGQGRPLR